MSQKHPQQNIGQNPGFKYNPGAQPNFYQSVGNNSEELFTVQSINSNKEQKKPKANAPSSFPNNIIIGPSSKFHTALEYHEQFGQLQPNFQDKKFNFNIIYYDEALTNNQENSDNNICSYFKTNLQGAFYGVNNFNVFMYLCQKIQNNSKNYILINAGFCAEKLYSYFDKMNMNNIYAYYIVCQNLEKYLPLMKKYPKIKKVINNFDDLIKAIFSNPIHQNMQNKSSNIIFLSEYNNDYIKFHFEIAKKYSLYKLLKINKSFDKTKYAELIKNKSYYYKDLAGELVYNNDEALIQYFQSRTKVPESELRQIFNYNHDIKNFIGNYKAENFYYHYINKFIREYDFKSFKVLSNHISKFIYHLLEYKKVNFQQSISTLYKKLYISKDEYFTYLNSIGKVICYPSFAFMSLKNNVPSRISPMPNSILVTLIIQQNHCGSIINIKNLSNNPNEDEFICLPFTFFKIIVVEKNAGNINIHLTALNSEKPIEDMFLNFMKNETDNLDPEGLDMVQTINDNSTLIINPKLKELFHKNNK